MVNIVFTRYHSTHFFTVNPTATVSYLHALKRPPLVPGSQQRDADPSRIQGILFSDINYG